MPGLIYDAAVPYDTPDYTYDGVYLLNGTIKDVLYRELRYGPTLAGLIANVKLDLRNAPPALRSPADYPALIFRRITSSENNQVNYARERIEMELIGRRADEDTLEAARAALITEFAGAVKTWGKFAPDGTPNPYAGLTIKGNHLSTVEGYTNELAEKAFILIFIFSYVRG